MQEFDPKKSETFIKQQFYKSVVPSLQQYIKIPNLSRSYDPDWNKNGLLMKAATHIKQWVEQLQIEGLSIEILKDQEYSPMIFTEVKGDIDETVLFYGHYDKQPPFTGWDEGMGPTTPVIKDGKLYGRGGADDGYATYGSLLSIKAIQQQKIKIPRCIMITQGDEESGSGHMPHYLQKLKERIGNPSYIFCLDSGTIDYDRFWLTTSLRGNLVATLRVQTLSEGVHSGDGSGVVPSCFRITNQLLSRLENVDSGQIIEDFQVNIPPNRYQEAHRLVQIIGDEAVKNYPFHSKTQPMNDDKFRLVTNRTWKPTLTVTGSSGLPQPQSAGNVLVPFCQTRFSLRLPPTLHHQQAQQRVRKILTSNPPYGASVEIKNLRAGKGWNSVPYEPFLEKAINEASHLYFNNEKLATGQGGSIPVIGMFADIWPCSKFLVSGVLGPNSNAHGPNQFLHLQYTRKLICAISHIIASVSTNKK